MSCDFTESTRKDFSSSRQTVNKLNSCEIFASQSTVNEVVSNAVTATSATFGSLATGTIDFAERPSIPTWVTLAQHSDEGVSYDFTGSSYVGLSLTPGLRFTVIGNAYHYISPLPITELRTVFSDVSASADQGVISVVMADTAGTMLAGSTTTVSPGGAGTFLGQVVTHTLTTPLAAETPFVICISQTLAATAEFSFIFQVLTE